MHARIDNGRAHFVDLDLPEAIAVRRRFVRETARHQLIASSALDTGWMGTIEDDRSVFFVAAGLLMYFESRDVRWVLRTLADRFPRGEMVFDMISA